MQKRRKALLPDLLFGLFRDFPRNLRLGYCIFRGVLLLSLVAHAAVTKHARFSTRLAKICAYFS